MRAEDGVLATAVGVVIVVAAAFAFVDAAPPASEVPADGFAMQLDSTQPFSFTYLEKRCVAMGVFFLVDRDHAQNQLPAGFVAERAADTVARFSVVPGPQQAAADVGAPLSALETDKTMVVLEAHSCRKEGSMLHKAGWAWIPIERPSGHEDLERSGFDFYEVCYGADLGDGMGAGSSPAAAARAAVGWAFCGDEMRADEPLHTSTGWTWQTDFVDAGAPSWSMAVRNAGDASVEVPGLYRVWHAGTAGTAIIDLLHVYGFEAKGEIHYSGDLDCSMAPGSIPAEVIGATSCADARLRGLSPVGGILPTHQMEVTVRFEPYMA